MPASLKTAACLFSLTCLLAFAAVLTPSAPADARAEAPLQTITIRAQRPASTRLATMRMQAPADQATASTA